MFGEGWEQSEERMSRMDVWKFKTGREQMSVHYKL